MVTTFLTTPWLLTELFTNKSTDAMIGIFLLLGIILMLFSKLHLAKMKHITGVYKYLNYSRVNEKIETRTSVIKSMKLLL